MKTSVLLVIIFYILIVYIIGFIASKFTKNVSDYIIGNRKLNTLATALGAGASDMSAWLMMALPGAVFVSGVTQVWLPMGLSIGAYINWKFVAKKLRGYTKQYGNSLTIPWYFASRLDDKSGLLRIVTGTAITIFSTVYVASAFVSCALVFQFIFNIDYTTALLISGLIIVVYTSIGGFLAINWIDVFQGMLMLFALLLVPAVIVMNLGGLTSTVEILNRVGLNISDPFTGVSNMEIASLLVWGLGYFGQPHILVRFMGAKSTEIIDSSRKICMTWMVLSLLGAFLVGVFGRALFGFEENFNYETIFLKASDLLFHPLIAGILFSAVLSAIMSTISALLLVSSSSLVEDVCLQCVSKKTFTPKQELFFNKAAVFLIAAIAIIIAFDPKNTILELVSYAWGGFGATIGPVILLSLYWNKITKFGAILGIICGGATLVIWKNLHGGIFDLYELAPGFVMGIIGILLGSIIERRLVNEK